MTVSLLDVASKTTPAQSLALLLHYLTTSGLPATAWQPGSVPRTLLEGEAIAYADAQNLAAAIANGSMIDLSAGEWLTQFADNFYDTQRKLAIFAKGTVTISNASGAAFSAAAGTLLASSTQSAASFRILDAITSLANGSSIEVTAQAEEAGLTGNVAVNTITTLLTPYPGISVSNPGALSVWLTQIGTRDESDESLRTRCKARWPQLGGGPTLLAYEGWAISVEQVTQARVFPNTDLGGLVKDGKVLVIIAGDSNPLDGAVAAAVDLYMTPKLGICVRLSVNVAAAYDLPVSATVYVEPAYLATAEAAADTALRALVADRKIGQRLYRAEIIEALMSTPGVGNVDLTSPSNDTDVPQTSILSLLTAPNLTIAPLP